MRNKEINKMKFIHLLMEAITSKKGIKKKRTNILINFILNYDLYLIKKKLI